MKNIDLALQYSLTSEASVALINLFLYLKLQIQYLNTNKYALESHDFKNIWAPIKRVLNDHHFDRLCMLETLR